MILRILMETFTEIFHMNKTPTFFSFLLPALLVIVSIASAQPGNDKTKGDPQHRPNTLQYVTGVLMVDMSAKGGVDFSADATAGASNIQLNVGDSHNMTLTAKDKNNNIIRDWNVPSVGMATTVTIKNSTANTDSSAVSWDADPRNYSWAELSAKRPDGTIVPLTKVSDNVYTVPQDLFVDGVSIHRFLRFEG